VAFVMRDDWKEEPVSTTGAEYVEPSASEPLRPGQRVSHLFPRSLMEEYVLQRLTARTYWVSRHFYGTLFYVGEQGVLLFDPPQGAADSLLRAIASVTSLPVTALCYSHFHADHIGGARKLAASLASSRPSSRPSSSPSSSRSSSRSSSPLRVIASEHTAVWMSQFDSDLPLATDILAWPDGVTSFEDISVCLRGLPRPGHSPDHAVFLLPSERVGHSADLINIDQLPFGGFAGQDPLVLFKPNLEFARSLDFDWFCGGHGNIGEHSDFSFYIDYLDEVSALISQEVPRPDVVPDLYLTDYLDSLSPDERTRLLTELDNHFAFYLYGRAIVKGEAAGPAPGPGPGPGAGPGARMGGLVGEWTAQRQQAVESAVPRILERLRPKYGRMYNFDDAQPINIRLLAMSMQASLSNR
jgi:glyoxylase-like metal-dependent hydrolase (beta-lactamase superfamily II)